MDLELCIESFESALLAQKYPFKRVELCFALDLGGLTPSAGMISKISALEGIETHVMIRPRAGNFCYSDQELRIMQDDIQHAKELGAHGVVFGVLDEQLNLNQNATGILADIAHSKGLEVTFHRAFDRLNDPLYALEDLISLNVDRILTSGQKPTALEGVTLITEMARLAKNRTQIMAGSGINDSNVLEFIPAGVNAIHFTARKQVPEPEEPGMGIAFEPDPQKIEKIVNKLQVE